MRVKTKPKISLSLIRRILTKFGLSAEQITQLEPLPPEKGYRNTTIPLVFSRPVWLDPALPGISTINASSTNSLNYQFSKLSLVFFKQEPNIKQRVLNADAVSTYLAQNHFPTRWPLLPKKISKQVKSNQINSSSYLLKITSANQSNKIQLAALYPYLPGKTISWEAYTQKHLKLLGKTMSQIHQQLSSQDFKRNNLTTTLPSQISICSQLLAQMEAYFAKKGVKQALKQKLKLKINYKLFPTAQNLLKTLKNQPTQPMHMDFVRSNILFQDSPLTISGILDWEKTAFGPKVLDLARTLAFLLVDCKYKTTKQIKKYFIDSGYFKRGEGQFALNEPQIQYLDSLVSFFLFYDFYKFLRHNPYQYLKQNQHFKRTKKILLSRNLINSKI